MALISHCKQWWPVQVQYHLKADEQHPHLKFQVVVMAKCPNCDIFAYRWYGIHPDGRQTTMWKIKERDLESDWLPRFKDDLVNPDESHKDTKLKIYVSQHTSEIAKEPEKALEYLNRKKA